MTLHLPGLEPSAPVPDPASDQELTLAVARWLSAHRRPKSGPVPRVPVETVVFGEMARAMRTQAGLGRVALARRARLNPLYLSLMEMAALPPNEIPAVAVAKLGVALGRSLDELPATPYALGAEPADEVSADAGRARLRLGFDTLRPWTDAMTARAGMAAVSISLPDVLLAAGGASVRIAAGQFANLMTPASPPGEYAARQMREAPAMGPWWVHASVLRSGLPAAGVDVGLRMGAQWRWSRVDDLGELHFGDLEPDDIEPLEVVLAR